MVQDQLGYAAGWSGCAAGRAGGIIGRVVWVVVELLMVSCVLGIHQHLVFFLLF